MLFKKFQHFVKNFIKKVDSLIWWVILFLYLMKIKYEKFEKAL